MGLFRKIASVSTAGMIDFRSDKERTAAYTRKAAKEAKKQRKLMETRTGQTELMAKQQALEEGVNHVRGLVEELKALEDLRERGTLTNEEFEAAKQRLLS